MYEKIKKMVGVNILMKLSNLFQSSSFRDKNLEEKVKTKFYQC